MRIVVAHSERYTVSRGAPDSLKDDIRKRMADQYGHCIVDEDTQNVHFYAKIEGYYFGDDEEAKA